MYTRSFFAFLFLFRFGIYSAFAQAPPFSYRGVYETTLPSGTKLVFFVGQDSQCQFGSLNTASQVVADATFSIAANGTASFTDSFGGFVSATFTATGVSGSVSGQSFNAPRTVLNSINGSLQGGYSGTLWFQADGSLNYGEVVLTPSGKLYALANTTTGLQGAIGTWSENGTFSGIGIPGGFALNGSATYQNGVLNGSYATPGTTVYLNGTKENLTFRLANISTRGSVGTDANQMIAGFIIKNGAKRVLIRAIGPSLTSLGVPGALNDPVLVLNSPSAVIATNDNWQVGNDIAAIQATGLAPNDTRESALLVSLEEGAYTAIVSGSGGTTGIALVEVYEID